MSSERWRVAAGFLFAPIAPCALYVAVPAAFALDWRGMLFMTMAMVVVAEILTLVLAVPAYLVLKRYRSIGLWECIVAGVAIAIAFNLAGLSLPLSSGYSAGDSGGATVIDGKLTAQGFNNWVIGTLSQSGLGAAIGFAFWLIAIYRRSRPA